jgi:hypothetical protein
MSELKKYVLIDYDSGDISFGFFETDIEEDTKEFCDLIYEYGWNSNIIVVEFEKFREAILELVSHNASLLPEYIVFNRILKKDLE